MSQRLIARSPDLQRLQDEGYEIQVKDGHLLVGHVPYVTPLRVVALGTLVSTLDLAGDQTAPPSSHVVSFAGDRPCHSDGTELAEVIHSSQRRELWPGFAVDHTFSSRPRDGYVDYHHKMTTYVDILSRHARRLDSTVTATTFPVIAADDEESVFRYIDTASSRAGITAIAHRLELERVAIVGVGGCGAYVLDLVAKTPVHEIHLFDGDILRSHNAFRSPGAVALEALRERPLKAAYFADTYGRMHRNVIAHCCYVTAENVKELRAMTFVFVCTDAAPEKRVIIGKLEEFGIPFVDVGMGVYEVDGALAGVLRTTTSTPQQRSRAAAKARIPLEPDEHNEYSRNIQVADLNALNAALAVVRWKKLFGFYLDLEREHHSTYTIDGNAMTNEDAA